MGVYARSSSRVVVVETIATSSRRRWDVDDDYDDYDDYDAGAGDPAVGGGSAVPVVEDVHAPRPFLLVGRCQLVDIRSEIVVVVVVVVVVRLLGKRDDRPPRPPDGDGEGGRGHEGRHARDRPRVPTFDAIAVVVFVFVVVYDDLGTDIAMESDRRPSQ